MNLERFKATLAYIEEHPEEYDQQSPGRCFLAIANRLFKAERIYVMYFSDSPNTLQLANAEEFEWIFNGYRNLEEFRRVANTGVIPV